MLPALVLLNQLSFFWTCSSLFCSLTFPRYLWKLFLSLLLCTIFAPRVAASSTETMYSVLPTHCLNLCLSIMRLTIFRTRVSLFVCRFEDRTACTFYLCFCVFSVFCRFWLSFWRSSAMTASFERCLLSAASFHLNKALDSDCLWRLMRRSFTRSMLCLWYLTASLQTYSARNITSWCFFMKFLNICALSF